MLAALQQFQGTITVTPPPRRAEVLVAVIDEAAACSLAATSAAPSMVAQPGSTRSREFIIQGISQDGRTLRPSDWAERLASTMSCFRPAAASGSIGAFIGYSPYCVPTVVGDLKCIICQ